jgi:hypothetical protein
MLDLAQIEIDTFTARRMAAEKRLIEQSRITPWLRGERFPDGSCVYVERNRSEIDIIITRDGPPLHFPQADAFNAELNWCVGYIAVLAPIAIAAITGLSPNEVRPHLDHMERGRPMSILSVQNTLESIGCHWRLMDWLSDWPSHGLARIQWDGPCDDNAAHWVATTRINGKIWVFDYSCIHVGGWVSAEDWAGQAVPSLTKYIDGANGGWRMTHAFEVSR